ncbi:hypothetical protein DP43_5422 [Burkholderia pseudomallei]|nr:hypothetical protein DP43_5422 [Burkholderia pseudomallei]
MLEAAPDRWGRRGARASVRPFFFARRPKRQGRWAGIETRPCSRQGAGGMFRNGPERPGSVNLDRETAPRRDVGGSAHRPLGKSAICGSAGALIVESINRRGDQSMHRCIGESVNR